MQQASKQMMRLAQRGPLFQSRALQSSVMAQTPRRNVSLLINDQFLDDDQKMIQ